MGYKGLPITPKDGDSPIIVSGPDKKIPLTFASTKQISLKITIGNAMKYGEGINDAFMYSDWLNGHYRVNVVLEKGNPSIVIESLENLAHKNDVSLGTLIGLAPLTCDGLLTVSDGEKKFEQYREDKKIVESLIKELERQDKIPKETEYIIA